MSGFLGHLVKRSLTDRVEVRPRPVSIFEPIQPAAQDAAFGVESRATADEHLRTEGQFTSAVDPISRTVTAASPRHVQERPAQETAPQPEPFSNPRGASLRGSSQKPPRPEPRTDRAPTAVLAEVDMRGPEARSPAPPAANLVEEQAQLPSLATSGRHDARAREASHAQEKPRAPQRLLGEPPIQAVTEPNPPESTAALRARRLQVQGKPAAQPDAANAKLPAPFPAPAQAPSESPGRTADAGLVPRTVASLSDSPLRGTSHKEPATPAQATLAPRLPRLEPVAQQMVQLGLPAISKPAEPIVHVTIGRVEIRAVAAPAAPKRAAPVKPTLSLSDYLHRRNGGRG